MRQFWGQQQRFFKEMASASKVEFVVAQAKEALESGMSVVVGLQSTGESGMDKVGSAFGEDKCLMDVSGRRPTCDSFCFSLCITFAIYATGRFHFNNTCE